MKTLLAFFYNHFEFLYLSSRYRITDSSTSETAMDAASLTLTGATVTIGITIDRGQISCDVAPTKLASRENWFRVPIVRQLLDNFDESNRASSADTAAWVRDNIHRIEALFSDDAIANSCKRLSALEEANAIKYFGRPENL